MTWQLPQSLVDESYCVLEHGDIIIVVPATDTAAHEPTTNCSCKPETFFADKKFHVVHNRFEDIDAIDGALTKLFGK